jgi:N-acetylglucosaminyl-diphospho-decaprenol L-rhamnosyltransferase
MHVAVVIVGFRNAEDVRGCLGALANSAYRDFEVVICENGGDQAFADLTDVVPATLQHGQPVRAVMAPGNVGYAGGVNIGIREAPGADAFWVLNPDTAPEPEALGALVARLQRGDCDVVGGILYGSDDKIQTVGGRWRPWLARTESLGRGNDVASPPAQSQVEPALSFISGASMLVSRRFLETVGPMREDYFLYCEEVEWCLRGAAKGMRLGFTPDARVLHNQGASTGSARAMRLRPRLPIYLDERNKLLVGREWFPRHFFIAAPAALVMLGLRYLRRGAWRQFGYGFSGWLAGLRGQRGRIPTD